MKSMEEVKANYREWSGVLDKLESMEGVPLDPIERLDAHLEVLREFIRGEYTLDVETVCALIVVLAAKRKAADEMGNENERDLISVKINACRWLLGQYDKTE